jgi:uncharacterized hydrophobic protein (TIGR00271 family)
MLHAMSTTDPEAPSPPPPSTALSPLGQMIEAIRPSNRIMSEAERDMVTDELFWQSGEVRSHLTRFFVLIVLSTLLAAFGLAANSVAVIIGAMLVAPLMTPILATAASLLLADLRMLLSSVAVIAAGVVMAIGTSTLVTWLGLRNFTTTYSLPSEILGRTQPSLLDLGVAIAAGLAGGYVLTHPKASSSLPGVAIAVALVPPLATVGILLAIGAQSQAGGAFLLFLTNLFAIVLSAIVVMVLSGFVPPEIRLEGLRNARIGLIVSAVVLVAIAVPLTVHTIGVVQDQRFAQTVTLEVAAWDPNATIENLVADLQPGGRAAVDLVVSTTSVSPQPSWKLADAVSARIGRVVDVSVRYRLEAADEATSG